jgi:hypothetical protein
MIRAALVAWTLWRLVIASGQMEDEKHDASYWQKISTFDTRSACEYHRKQAETLGPPIGAPSAVGLGGVPFEIVMTRYRCSTGDYPGPMEGQR